MQPYIQLFRERFSEEVLATIPKGIVGGLELTVLQINLKEWGEKPWTFVCERQRKAAKVGSTVQCQEQYIDYSKAPWVTKFGKLSIRENWL